MVEQVARVQGKGVEQKFSTREQMTESLTETIIELLSAGIERNGKASFLVSGGRTPAALFEQLCQADLDWDKVWITLVDERWVAPEDDASNEKLVRNTLLQGRAANAHFIPMKNVAETAEEGVIGCAEALSVIPEPFDVVILGMGDDGHTASLFPCSDELETGLDLGSGQKLLAVNPKTAPHGRMSYTLPALLNSKQLFLLITGDSKWDVYQTAIQNGSETAIREMPIRAFLFNQSIQLDVYWAQ